MIKVKGLPYNKYTWLTTHNSFARIGARSGTGSMILAPSNQQDSITSQLIVNIHKLISNISFFPSKKRSVLHSFDKPILEVYFCKFDYIFYFILWVSRMVLEGLCLTCTTSKTIYGFAILMVETASTIQRL